MRAIPKEIRVVPFGTDGVRGVVGKDLTPEYTILLGRAAALSFSQKNSCSRMIIGKDTRQSCDMLESALTSGILSSSLSVISLGVIPTPGVAYLAKEWGCPAAVISASHNPWEHNGIKFFGSEGYKISEIEEKHIISAITDVNVAGEDISVPGHYKVDHCGAEEYERHLIKSVNCNLKGLRVGLDCANGATFKLAPEILNELGAEIYVTADRPDGKNINEACGSTHTKNLADLVQEKQLDIGIAYDGDGDRVIVIDEAGSEVDGDFIMAVIAADHKKRGLLKNDSIVTTVMTNLGFDLAMRKIGINVIKCDVGDRFVIEKMKETGSRIGGEQSGHIILSDYGTTGDGILTSLELLKIMAQNEKPLSVLASVMTRAPQKLVNIIVKDKSAYHSSNKISEKIDSLSQRLGDSGRILVRPSGTEPLIRVMVEAEQESVAFEIADELANIIAGEMDGTIKN